MSSKKQAVQKHKMQNTGKRDLRSIRDFSLAEVEEIYRIATDLKQRLQQGETAPLLQGKTLAMLFEKPSLRTRCTFDVGMRQLGGHALYIGPEEVGLGKRESTHDIAKNLERWVDLVTLRTFAHSNITELARHCACPVINALSDEEHPCQALADFYTVLEHRGSFDGFTLTYVGDGNNICHSLMLLTALLGTRLRLACPEGYEPKPEILEEVHRLCAESGAEVTLHTKPEDAVHETEAIYTDVWASMGQEGEAERRRKAFAPYQVNRQLVTKAPPNVYIMHDLPAHRGEEITDEVMDSPQSIVFDQAENRLHVQKAIMVFLSHAVDSADPACSRGRVEEQRSSSRQPKRRA